MRRSAALAGLLSLAFGCASATFAPPAGAGVPADAADVSAAWTQATETCRSVHVFEATVHVNGHVNGNKLNAPLDGKVSDRDEIYFEARAPIGTPALYLAGNADGATLLLPRDARVLKAKAADIVEALTGLRMTPRELLAVLSGCVVPGGPPTGGARYGPTLRVDVGAGRVFLVSEGGRWRVKAGQAAGGVLVDYVRVDGLAPREIRLTAATPLDLTLTTDEIGLNTGFDPKALTLRERPGDQPMTVDELRAIGPLREKGGS